MLSPGELIQRERKKQRLSQKQLAEISGIPKRTIQNIEENKNDATFFTMICLAQALGISLDYIAKGE